jgi:hypothetical protein
MAEAASCCSWVGKAMAGEATAVAGVLPPMPPLVGAWLLSAQATRASMATAAKVGRILRMAYPCLFAAIAAMGFSMN